MNRAHYASVDKVVHAFRRSNVDNYKSNSVRKGEPRDPGDKASMGVTKIEHQATSTRMVKI